ncbi:unnamed protein product [Sphagnum jensenii]|uniref:Uncharacterized protein n=1 Tax=Sphagnum jensenii TaxID=128206 RepID=A0ABP1A1Q6_9BRYO
MAAGFGLFVSEEALNVWVRVSKLVFSVTTFLIYFFFFLVSVQGPMYLCDLGLWRTSSSITNHLLWALQVGTSLGRCLTWDQTREVLVSSLSANASYITSTVLWVYWGVCISDMVPFYAGRIAAKSGTGKTIWEKVCLHIG